jgi:mannose-6-phosphate isomerase-like protein (cupin superfamily)
MDSVRLENKFSQIHEQWKPKNVARLNDYHIKVVKLQGEFVWHSHVETEELFLVHRGEMLIRLRDGEVRLGPGELFVVPRGVEHCPFAAAECEVVLIEPAGTVNTGDAGGERTASPDEWI